jgi:hypothetical protein
VSKTFYNLIVATLLIVLNFFPIELFAQSVSYLDYTPPILNNSTLTSYPSESFMNGQQGWVILNFMVDADGKPFEPVVVDSIGPQRHHDRAIDRLMDTLYQPATLNGTAVEGSSYMRFVFRPGVTPYSYRNDLPILPRKFFVTLYEKFFSLIDSQQSDEARRALAELSSVEELNIYEAAFVDFAEYRMAFFESDVAEQLEHLRRALSYEELIGIESFLPLQLVPVARFELLKLQVESKHYAEALSTFETVRRTNQRELVDSLQPLMDEISSYAGDDSFYSVDAQIRNTSTWFLELAKPAFSLTEVQGNIDEISVACEAKYAIFPFKKDVEYNIPENWGSCTLRILGDPGTGFTVWQMPRAG